ncbi:GNAT family N-acetyltransferase [Aestuariispira ectoiniformans]|uniref:GNAT family N-acetyltransferase n=1 Tax=Aestuariispira ectoiniformans TaxID=2775080 RepID=UPI0035CD3A1A
MTISLRKANKEDAQLLYEWSQDKVVREMSLSSEQFSWEVHERWFANKMASDRCRIYIAEDGAGQPVGQIRFDLVHEDRAEVAVYTDPHQRGRGLGAGIIQQGTVKFVECVPVKAIDAIIKVENLRSRKAFLKAGYKEIGQECIQGRKCYRLRCIVSPSR